MTVQLIAKRATSIFPSSNLILFKPLRVCPLILDGQVGIVVFDHALKRKAVEKYVYPPEFTKYKDMVQFPVIFVAC